MYLARVSVRRVEDITGLVGHADLNKKIYGIIEASRNRPIEVEHPHQFFRSAPERPARSSR
jgi:hypothetical protein